VKIINLSKFKMKKNIIATVMMLMATGSVWAADPTAALVSPTIPAMVTVSPNATSALNDPTTNSVFIDQSGSNPTVNMTQIGTGNKMGSALSPIYLRGQNQNIVVIQSGVGSASGNNNVVDLQVLNDTTALAGGASSGASVTIRQLGNSNTVDAICGDSAGNCNKADINWRFAGNSNTMVFRGRGSELTSQIDVAGNGNAFNIAMIGDKHSQIINVDGGQNVFNLSQTSTGSTGSSIAIAQQGSGTTYNVNQTGSVNNVLSINSAAQGGSFNILQRN
jgi:hypothetical protein